MRYLKSLLYSTYAWSIISACFVLHFLIATVLMPFQKDPQGFHQRLAVPFIRLMFYLGGIHISVQNAPNLSHKNVMYFSNHLSHLDILVLMMVLPGRFSFVAKKELFWIPFLGWDLYLEGHIGIDRQSMRSAQDTLGKVRQKLDKGINVVIFPEGTRSPNGHLSEFKRFPFSMALSTGATIIPCVISGTNRILSKHSLILQPGHVQVSFCPEINTGDFQKDMVGKAQKEKTEALLNLTRERISQVQKVNG